MEQARLTIWYKNNTSVDTYQPPLTGEETFVEALARASRNTVMPLYDTCSVFLMEGGRGVQIRVAPHREKPKHVELRTGTIGELEVSGEIFSIKVSSINFPGTLPFTWTTVTE